MDVITITSIVSEHYNTCNILPSVLAMRYLDYKGYIYCAADMGALREIGDVVQWTFIRANRQQSCLKSNFKLKQSEWKPYMSAF